MVKLHAAHPMMKSLRAQHLWCSVRRLFILVSRQRNLHMALASHLVGPGGLGSHGEMGGRQPV